MTARTGDGGDRGGRSELRRAGGDPGEVAVLGSARLGADDPAWAVASDVGAGLARAGATVVTGGYGGLMAAAAAGAVSAGGRVVGLPMRAWTHLEPDPQLTELRWAASYAERLAVLLACGAVVAIDGGVGTLSELAVVWAAAQTEPGAPTVVAVGARWRALRDGLARSLVAGDEDFALVRWAPDAATAVSLALDAPTSSPLGARG
jgi:uncharacterized protein (TIGR00725 family)